MTTYVQAREALVTHLNTSFTATYPSIPMFYENTTQVNLDAVGNAFVAVSINFTDAMRLNIDSNPKCRSNGELSVRIFAKEGQGVTTSLGLIDYLTDLMKFQELSGVTTETPFPGKKEQKDGWLYTDLIVPFFFYT